MRCQRCGQPRMKVLMPPGHKFQGRELLIHTITGKLMCTTTKRRKK